MNKLGDRSVENISKQLNINIEHEFNRIRELDRLVVGNILAVIERSDVTLGRNESEVKEGSKSIYVLCEPSKIGLVSMTSYSVIANCNTNIKFISISHFMDQILELNFTFLQLIYTSDVLYASEEYKEILKKTLNKLSSSEIALEFVKKSASMLLGLIKQVSDGFESDEVLQDRAFLALKVISTAEDTIKNEKITFNKSCKIYQDIMNANLNKSVTERNKYVVNAEISNALTHGLKHLDEFIENSKSELVLSKQEYKQEFKVNKLSTKCELLSDLYINILNRGE